MAAGLRVYKDNGVELFDTEKITYGLLKSGYLSLQDTWPRLELRSADLNPFDPASWKETSPIDQIYGFSVTGAVVPIVFINGAGNAVGSSRVGTTTTFYFTGASASTKYYYYDSMRGTITGAGLKCYDTTGAVTFNSLQVPLDIEVVVTAPGLGSQIAPGSPWYNTPYTGGVDSIPSYAAGPMCTVTMSLPAGEYASSITFSRGGTVWGGGVYPFLAAIQEGSYGITNGVVFRFRLDTRTTQNPSEATNAPLWSNIPTDRIPQALVIRTNNLPFPFN